MNAILILSLVVLVSLSAFFSASETVLFSLSPIQIQRLREKNAAAGRRVAKVLADPATTLSVILVGNTIANIAIASLGYALIADYVPKRYAELIAIPLMTLFLLLFGEISPKQVAINHAPRLAPYIARTLLLVTPVFKPVCLLLKFITKPLMSRQTRPESRAVTDEELLTVVEVGEEQGLLDQDESSMVSGIMRLSELTASDVMTPRVDLVGIDLRDPPEMHLQTARESPYPYLPVWNRTPDAVESLLDIQKFLLDPAHDLRNALSPPFFTPENISLDDLLISFKRGGHRIACVVDEFGGIAGVVSRGDILDIIMDDVEITDKDDHSEIQRIGNDRYLIDGMTPLHTINHELDTDLTAESADRLAGWVTFHAAGLPRRGQQVEAQGCRVTVTKRRKRRLLQLELQILPRQENDTPGVIPDLLT